MDKLGQRLKKISKKLKLSQQEISDTLGLPRNTIWRWFNNIATPNGDNLQKLAKLLRVSVDELLSNNKQEHWAVEVVIGDYEEEEMIDLSKDMLSITRLNATSNGINVNLIGGWDMVMNNAKFADMLEQVKAQREKLIKVGTEVFNISNDYNNEK